MRYLKFRIQNFKGIKDTEIDLRSTTGANVFSFVGLNESGKTTILEAIHSFSPDHRTSSLRGDRHKDDAVAAKERLPRHLIARFSGEISVSATVSVTRSEKATIAKMIETDDALLINENQIPDIFIMKRSDLFHRGDYVKTVKTYSFPLEGRTKGARKDRKLTDDQASEVYSSLYSLTPDIAYHDSFIFDFPKRIYLTNRPGASGWVFRKMFEDVLAAGRVSYEIEDITRRIRTEKYNVSWIDFFTNWSKNDDIARVQQIIDQASETITDVVFGKWNKIFKEDVGDKEISVQYGVEQGRLFDKINKAYIESHKHDLYISLEIKDGTRRFPIQDRSLGFRWFFAFLLFTQFRTKRGEDRPVLFLFDEPAANLHSAAQERLIESFPDIATGDNMLLYSTHSHYMISPDWLEQTFIVTNATDSPSTSVVESAVLEDDSLDIKAQLYRSFANDHPSETSYFQPIIDRLQVRPSQFDISLPSAIVEGKSDFYILRYSQLQKKTEAVRIIPGTGSGTFSSLIALGAAWGTKFLFLLDSDNAGLKERARYALEHGARKESLCSLEDFDADIKEIEDILDAEAKAIISSRLGLKKLSKKAISRFFQEQLAKREFVSLGAGFERRSEALLSGLAKQIAAL